MNGETFLGFDALERLAEPALALPEAAAVEVVAQRTCGGLTRFALSEIHQNVWSEDTLINVRVVTGDGRVGVAGTHTHDTADVRSAAERALAIARVTPPDDEFAGLATAAEATGIRVDERTVALGPEQRAAAVRQLLTEVPRGFTAAGAFETSGGELAVLTTAGQRIYTPISQAQLNIVVERASSSPGAHSGASGYAEAGGRSVDDIDTAATAERAARKAEASADPVEVPPGRWPVVLEPLATGTLVQFLTYVGFGAREYLEERSFVSGRLGTQVLDPKVTITDDGRSPDTVGLPFDYEGTPKQRVELVRNGVLAGVVHDRFTASQVGTASTGHALLAPNPHGPIATNPLLLAGNDGTIDDLVAGLERGLLVTRFHYTNIIHPVTTTMTGMTRDGTFLVEDGRITKPVRNLRFLESILDAFAQVEAISTETGYGIELYSSGSRYPAVRLPSFHFASGTSF